ncbi:MAG: hypothetical protein ACSHYB_09415 [Roseibacillus sp.]
MLLCGAFVLGLSCSSVFGEARVFHSSDGVELEAVFKGTDGKAATLERASDGKVFAVPLERLSKEDQRWIRDWEERRRPDEPMPAVVHPLGWTQLTIHDLSRQATCSFVGVQSANASSYAYTANLYLPKGVWLSLGGDQMKGASDSLVLFDGERDWFVEQGERELRLKTAPEGVARVVGISWGNRTTPEQKERAVEAIELGACVEIYSEDLPEMVAQKLKPIAMVLNQRSEAVDWKSLPKSLRALHLNASNPEVSLAGIEQLENLEYFKFWGGSLKGLPTLSELPELRSLAVGGILSLEEIKSLGTLTGLRHLAVSERTKENLPADTFNCLGQLKELETFSMGSHWIHDKYISPDRTLENSPRLTTFEFNTKFFGEGRFLEHLPKLFSVELLNQRIDAPFIERLMQEGHFKHLQKLETRSSLPVGDLPQLQELTIACLPGADFRSVGSLPQLRTLQLQFATTEHLAYLLEHPNLSGVESLSLLVAEETQLEALAAMPNLRRLQLELGKRESLDLSLFKGLKAVELFRGKQLKKLTLPPQLQELGVRNMDALDFSEATPLPYLRRLTADRCQGLLSLDGLGACPELTDLRLQYCPELRSTSGLDEVKSLERCSIRGCGEVANQNR